MGIELLPLIIVVVIFILGTLLESIQPIVAKAFMLLSGLILAGLFATHRLEPTLQILLMMTVAYLSFQAASQNSFRTFILHNRSFQISSTMAFLIIIFVTLTTYFLTRASIISALILAISLAILRPSSKMDKKTESLITMILVFLLLFFIDLNMKLWSQSILPSLYNSLSSSFFGLGVGIIFGLFTMHFFKHYESRRTRLISLFAFILMSYLIAAAMNANGMISVFTVGLMYSMLPVRRREDLNNSLTEYSELFTLSAFFLLGYFLTVTTGVIFIAILILLIFLLCIHAAIDITYQNTISIKQKIIRTLDVEFSAFLIPVLILLYYSIPVYDQILKITLLLILLIYIIRSTTILYHHRRGIPS